MRERLVDLNYWNDERGTLGVYEQNYKELHKIKRVFWITVNMEGQIRGEHAHKSTSQLMICISGKMEVQCYDLNGFCNKYILEQSGKALLVPPMIWSTQKYVTSTSTLMVMCDQIFDENEYIRDKADFFSQNQLS